MGGRSDICCIGGLLGCSLTVACSLQIPTIGDPEEATGDYLSGIVGVRIATPFFGTGFNFCIGGPRGVAWGFVIECK